MERELGLCLLLHLQILRKNPISICYFYGARDQTQGPVLCCKTASLAYSSERCVLTHMKPYWVSLLMQNIIFNGLICIYSYTLGDEKIYEENEIWNFYFM